MEKVNSNGTQSCSMAQHSSKIAWSIFLGERMTSKLTSVRPIMISYTTAAVSCRWIFQPIALHPRDLTTDSKRMKKVRGKGQFSHISHNKRQRKFRLWGQRTHGLKTWWMFAGPLITHKWPPCWCACYMTLNWLAVKLKLYSLCFSEWPVLFPRIWLCHCNSIQYNECLKIQFFFISCPIWKKRYIWNVLEHR